MSDNGIKGGGGKPKLAPARFTWGNESFELLVSPSTFSYSYSMQTNSTDTKGGRVVQILSSSVDNISISGVIVPEWEKTVIYGNDEAQRIARLYDLAMAESDPVQAKMRWQAYYAESALQRRTVASQLREGFASRYDSMKMVENKIRSMMRWQTKMVGASNGREHVMGDPLTFEFRPEGWKGKVWIKSFGDIKYSVDFNLISYSITMIVADGFDAMKDIGTVIALEKLRDVNWQRDGYHMTVTADQEELLDRMKKLFESGGYTEGQSTDGGATFTASGTGDFPKYTNLTEDELKKIAKLCKQEQGSVKGAAVEASLAANLFELNGGSKYSSVYDYMRNSGWFGRAKYYMDKSGDIGDDYVNAVKSVLVDGKRVLPRYVNEHDMFPADIKQISTGDKRNRSNYIPNKTVVDNIYGSTWTFWGWPAGEKGDPFGYTSKAYEKFGGSEDCYTFEG